MISKCIGDRWKGYSKQEHQPAVQKRPVKRRHMINFEKDSFDFERRKGEVKYVKICG